MSEPWAALRAAMSGEVFVPGDLGYDAARRPQIPNFLDVRPRAVARCATAADVAAALRFGDEHGLPVVARSGGHCFGGRSSTTGLLIDVSPMNRISVAGDGVRIGAGARLGSVYAALDPVGFAIPAGCGETVGIAGLALGGGLGILGRRYGLTSDRLVGAQVVLPDGDVVSCSADEHPELLWLLRGAGAPGVVTELVFDPVPAPQPMTAFQLLWLDGDVTALVRAWQEWAPDAPDELAASVLVSAAGAAGRGVVASLHGAFLGTEEECVAALRPMLRLGPTSQAYRPGTLREVKHFLAGIDPHAAGPVDPAAHHYCASQFFAKSLSGDAIADLVAGLTTARPAGQVRELDFMPWGGAYCRMPTSATAFPHRDARFLLKIGLLTSPGDASGGRDWLRESFRRVRPEGTGGSYANFPDVDLDDPVEAYYGANASRVRELRQRYAPDPS